MIAWKTIGELADIIIKKLGWKQYSKINVFRLS
jgi:hypothetical protein